MKRFTRRFVQAVAMLGLMAGAAGQARADTTLLDLLNPPGQDNTPYSLSFTASDSSTTISIAGYQVPSWIFVTDNGLFLNGIGPNLLGSTWNFAPAASGSDTYLINDGTSVPGLALGGVSVGYYDTYSQTIASTPGQSYTLDFLFSNNDAYPTPSELIVTTSANVIIGTVPEPSTLVSGIIAGLMGLGYAWRRRRARMTAR